jgi:methylated-DNA-[protein]-cysteine S-methyltransferase
VITETLATPIGALHVGATAAGLARGRFPRPDGRQPTSARDRPPADGSAGDDGDDAARRHLDAAVTQLSEYFHGDRTTFDVPIDWSGVTGLRLAVLQALRDTVPFGRTTTYGVLARAAGSPEGSQAVGQIMGGNPVPVVVACHRVLAADGLGGFGGGRRTKEWLLSWEGSLTPALDLGL